MLLTWATTPLTLLRVLEKALWQHPRWDIGMIIALPQLSSVDLFYSFSRTFDKHSVLCVLAIYPARLSQRRVPSETTLSCVSGDPHANVRNDAAIRHILAAEGFNPLATNITAQCNFCARSDCSYNILCDNVDCGVSICATCALNGVSCGCPKMDARVKRLREQSGREAFESDPTQQFSFEPFLQLPRVLEKYLSLSSFHQRPALASAWSHFF